jgi:hypothetical protein
MKTIKFFSFAMLLSLAWASCKDASTASTETATAEVLADSVFTATKTAAVENLTGLQQVTLKGTGTPVAAGTFSYPLTGGGNTCQFSVTSL